MYVFPAGKTVFPCYSLTLWGFFGSLCRSLKDRPWRTRVQRTSSPVWCVFGVFLLLGTICVSREFYYRAASAGEPGWKPPGKLTGDSTQRLPGRVPVLAGQLGAGPGAPGAAAPVAVRGQRGQSRRDPARCGSAAEPLCPARGRSAEPQNSRTAELQDYRATELQNRRTAEPQNHRTAEPQGYRTAELQNCRTTELHLPAGCGARARPGRARGGPGGSADSASTVPSPARLGPVRSGR